MSKKIPNNEVYEQISEWLEIYHSTGDMREKAQMQTNIVRHMLPVVKKLARTIARRANDPVEDMIQAGSIGLLRAIDYYSKAKNNNFRIYAGYFIIGEMKHYLRDKMSTIHVPRHIQELCIRINNFTSTLTEDELRSLTSDEVASALELPKATVDFAMMADRRRTTVSFEDVFNADNNSKSFEELIAAKEKEDITLLNDIKIIVNELIDILPPEIKVIIDMYYNQDMNQREISEALQISKMIVYRRMKRAFNLIAEHIAHNKVKKQKIINYLEKDEDANG